MPTITFATEKKEIQVPEGANLRKEAIAAGVALYPGVHKVLNCHGNGIVWKLPGAYHKGNGKHEPQEEFLRKLGWVSLWPTSAMKRPCDSHVKHESMETLLSPPVPR